ncbi:roadblock/LC7 domain-containing protein [Malonomonas rubra]|uniref:roadblock/LC7 domain-containing protein n=1 Tax=Malonomonas rubra TaxID=57040 RepID=UPI0026F2B5D3|nr:roadblock/LC7 domain-containing protein [Malonomonas rubra]
MPFKSLLNRLLEDIPGALGAIIIDWEGEAVDHVARMEDYDIKVFGAHNGIILQLLRDAMARIDCGVLQEVLIRTGENKTLLAPLTDEYFLVLTLGPQSIASPAAFRMRCCVAELRPEFEF